MHSRSAEVLFLTRLGYDGRVWVGWIRVDRIGEDRRRWGGWLWLRDHGDHRIVHVDCLLHIPIVIIVIIPPMIVALLQGDRSPSPLRGHFAIFLELVPRLLRNPQDIA